MSYLSATISSLADLVDADALARHTELAIGPVRERVGPLSICVAREDEVVYMSTDPVLADAGSLTPVGCLSRLLNVTVTGIAIEKGLVGCEDRVAPHFGSTPSRARLSDSLLLWHLLTHSDGLDGSMLPGSVPREADGRIDNEKLLHGISEFRPLADPGRLFVLQSASHWLLAAVLERAFGCTYAQLLEEQLGDRFGVRVACRPSACPFRGMGIAMSPKDVLKVAREHLISAAKSRHASPLSKLRTSYSVEAPRWMIEGEAIYPGWNRLQDDVYVAHGDSENGSITVLLQEQSGTVAVVYAKRPRQAPLVARRVFGCLWSRSLHERMPKVVPGGERSVQDLTRYTGVYANAAGQIFVDASDDSLYATGSRFVGGLTQRFAKARLVSCIGGLFVPELNGRPLPLHLAFSNMDDHGQYQIANTRQAAYLRVS